MKNDFDIVNDFFKKTHNCVVPRPQPIDFVLHFFNNAENLFFVDAGAHNGIDWSNTFVLEKYLKWTGICIEPQEKQFEDLKKNRDCLCLNNAVYSSCGKKTFRLVSGEANMLSGFVESFTKEHTNRIDKEISNTKSYFSDIQLNAVTLDHLFKENKINKVDYLSIDCECGEYEILRGLNLNIVKPTLISIEHNGDRISDKKCLNLLQSYGYSIGPKVCGDLFLYIN